MANLQVAKLAGGCFWCIESAFNSVEGVEKAISGYAGGEKAEAVCGCVVLTSDTTSFVASP